MFQGGIYGHFYQMLLTPIRQPGAIDKLDENYFNGIVGCNPGTYVQKSECKTKRRRQSVWIILLTFPFIIFAKQSNGMRRKLM